MIEEVRSHPLGFLKILVYTAKVFFGSIKEYVLLIFMVGLPVTILQSLISIEFLVYFGFWGNLLSTAVGLIALMPVVAVTLLADQRLHGKKEVKFFELFNQSFTLWPKIIMTYILTNFLITFGFSLLILPGIILMVYLTFANPITVLRGSYGFEAIRYSFNIVKSQWWKVFLYTLLLNVITIGFSLFVVSGIFILNENIILNILIQLFVSGLVYFLNTFNTILFLNIDYMKASMQ
ncbi:hypothetical protein [Vallitalea okinawensis]|uniref:hypothetical protein n=1 Tax=Vallitalea okinawensis TaxID=2078660 RepID=UPI000CFBD0C4|nr:hypothetical protein [Vallitalea okinawensis]